MEIPITSQSNIKNPSSGKAVPFIDSSDNIFKCKLSDGSLIKFDPSGSGSGTYTSEYYKCASVSSSSEVGNTLIVSGGTDIMFSYGGTYNIVDKTKSGYERMWKHESNDWYILSSNVDGYTDSTLSDYYWILVDFNPETAVIQPVKNSESILFDTNLGQHENPWDVTSWTYVPTSETKHDITITSSSTTKATSGGTWSGYKAIFDSSAGTWSFESNVTEGLTYTSVTPAVGVIYTEDALVTVASVYTGFYATSSPLNPGSNNSGVWEITASNFLDSNRNAYKAFDESLNSDNGCWHSQSGMPQWLQWRNTESKVLVKSYFLQNRSGSTGDYYPVEWTLSGSDDGVDWTELDNVVIQNSDTASGSKTVRNLPTNNTAYYYHRITITKAYNNSYATIGFLQAFNYISE